MKLFRLFQFSIFIALLGYAQIGHTAACCGGGFALPSLITGDDKAQLTTSYSYSKIDTDVFTNGIWQKRFSNDTTTIYKIEAAHIFADSFQAGFTLPIQTRNREGAQGGTSSGLGDISAQLGYEFLPDWNYNPYRPHGVSFISLTLPTGKSIYESDNAGLDSRGRGFFALGLGATLTKTWTNIDANLNSEFHHSFSKVVSNSQNFGNITPGSGYSISTGTGYNIDNFRLGGSVAWFYEDGIDVDGLNPSTGAAQRYASASLSTNYLFKDNWAGTLSYTDQTLLGDPSNATLTKSVQISLQKRWLR